MGGYFWLGGGGVITSLNFMVIVKHILQADLTSPKQKLNMIYMFKEKYIIQV
jgi:hypothetical protein